MQETWIVPSKLTPATPPPGWLYREGLPAGNALPGVSLLVAGPGYGKTLALVALTMRAQAAGKAVLYYSLDLYDADPATFFHYMVAGMQAHIPQFGSEIKALLAGEKFDPRLLWQRFFQSAASYNLPGLLLVFDDFHHLFESQEELVKAFMYFWDKLPPGMHVAIASRQRLPFGVSKFEAKGLLRQFQEPELRFTEREVDQFLTRRAPHGEVPAVWRTELEKLDHWPLGLDLVTTVAPERLGAVDRGSEMLMEYVAEELYEAQDADLRAFMLKAALLQELTPEACRWVFGEDAASDRLEALEAMHLVQRLEGGVGYRFPTYLRDFLQAEAERKLSGAMRADWHRRAADHYRDRRQDELALPHMLASRDWEAAMVACEAVFPAMRFSGRQALIGRWLEAFPEEVASSEPVVQLWRGHVHSRAGRITEATPYYERARGLYEARSDEAGVFKVLVRQCTLALVTEEMEAFATLLDRAQGLVGQGRDEDVADLYLTRALAAEQRGDMAAMGECNQAVLGVAVGENVEIAASQCIARMNLYTFELHRGQLARAHDHIAQAIELAERWSFYPYHLFARFLQAHLRVLEGDVEGAGGFLRQLPGHWVDLLDWHDVAVAYAVLGHYHQAKGEWKEAEEACRRSYSTFERAGFNEGKKVALEPMLWLAVSRKQYAKTAELLADAGEPGGQNIYDLALAIPHARSLHLQGEPASALAVLDSAIPALETLGAELHVARALLYAGASRYRTGDGPGAASAVGRAMAIAEARSYGFLTGQDQVLWEELAPVVNPPAELTRVVEAAPAPESPRAGARQGGLSLRCFGGFEARLDGVLLDQWPRRKAKLILAALLLYPRGLTLAQIAEMLGAQEVTPATLTTLKVDVSSLRRTLEPNLGKGQVSRYVGMEEDRYVIQWEEVEFLDLKAFDSRMATADSLRANSPAEAATAYEEALLHFRGNLLEDGVFRDAFEAERERYRQQAVGALVWLTDFHQSLGDNSGAEAVLKRAVEVAPVEEDLYIRLMRLQRVLGVPERIRQVYWDCRKAMKAHLGMTPSHEFEKAYQAIVSG